MNFVEGFVQDLRWSHDGARFALVNGDECSIFQLRGDDGELQLINCLLVGLSKFVTASKVG